MQILACLGRLAGANADPPLPESLEYDVARYPLSAVGQGIEDLPLGTTGCLQIFDIFSRDTIGVLYHPDDKSSKAFLLSYSGLERDRVQLMRSFIDPYHAPRSSLQVRISMQIMQLLKWVERAINQKTIA